MGWTYSAYRLNGDGTETPLAPELPLTGVSITQTLSGVGSLEGSLEVEAARLKGADTFSIFEPWRTAIYADHDGVLRGAGIVTAAPVDDGKCSITCVSWMGWVAGLPWHEESRFVEKDPLEVARFLLTRAQQSKGANIGLGLDINPASSPIRIGLRGAETWPRFTDGTKTSALREVGAGIQYAIPKTGSEAAKTMWGHGTREWKKTQAEDVFVLRHNTTGKLSRATTGGESPPKGYSLFGLLTTDSEPTENYDGESLEPWTVTYWADHDLGQKFEELAGLGSFEYAEDHRWAGESARHTLRIGFPNIGRVRTDLRFAVGENVTAVPSVEVDGDEYASHIVVLGAGEGRDMVRAEWPVPGARGLYRPKIHTDKTITTEAAAKKKAVELAKRWAGMEDIKEITVSDHPNARFGSWSLGDTVTYLGADAGWAAGRDMRVRILGQTISPEEGDRMKLAVARADKVTLGGEGG